MGFYNGILEEEWFFFIQEHLLTFFYFFFVGFRLGKLKRCFLEKIFCFFFIQERQLTFFTYFFLQISVLKTLLTKNVLLEEKW